MERVENSIEGKPVMKTIRLVIRVCSALIIALVVSSLVLAASGCAVPFVERPTAEVVLVPVA